MDTITTTVNGITYTGWRTTQARRRQRVGQCIGFGDQREYDGHGYRRGDHAYMELMAGTILADLVRRWHHVHGVALPSAAPASRSHAAVFGVCPSRAW